MASLQESGASRQRRRRRRRAAITLTVVGLVMVGTFVTAAAYFQGWAPARTAKPAASPICQVATPVRALAPRAVTINVYNATDRAGLAATAAKSLRTQGFRVAKVTNDPLGKAIDGVGEVRHGPTGAASAILAATRLSGARVVSDNRTDKTVDLVLGNKFTALSAPPKVASSKVASSKATRATPSPTHSC